MNKFETKIQLGTLFQIISRDYYKGIQNGYICICLEISPRLYSLYCINDGSKRYICKSHLYENGGIFKRISQ